MRPYIKICCPVYKQDTWDGALAKSCYESMIRRQNSFDVSLGVEIGNNIELSRNACINEDREEYCITQTLNHLPYTHYLMLDHDVGFFPEHIDRLISHNLPIVSGAYRSKEVPNQLVAGMCDDHGKILSYIQASQRGLLPVHWVGGGFILIKKEVFSRMKFPYFWLGLHYYGNRALMTGGDVYFCLNARSSGFDIVLDSECILNHEANRIIRERV